MGKGKLLKEQLISYDFYNYYTKFYDSETGKLVAHHVTRGPSLSYEYDSNGRIISEYHDEHLGGDPYDVYHKLSYHYEKSVIRIFKYKTGFTNYRDFNKIDFSFDPPKTVEPPIYEANELEEIHEKLLNEEGRVYEYRFNNLKDGQKEITKFEYDRNGNLIKRTKYIDGTIFFDESFKYDHNQMLIEEKTVDDLDNPITIIFEKGLKMSKIGRYEDIFYKYSEKNKEVERKYISKEGDEILKFFFVSTEYENEIHITANQSTYDYSLAKILELPNPLYDIHLDEYLNKTNSKIVIVIKYRYFNEENQIERIMVYNSDKTKILEQLFVVINSVSKGQGITQDILTGIKVKGEEVENIFTWLFDYQN